MGRVRVKSVEIESMEVVREPFARITFPMHDPAQPVKGLGKPNVEYSGAVDPDNVDYKVWGTVQFLNDYHNKGEA